MRIRNPYMALGEIYTMTQKNNTLTLTITLENVDRFSTFFSCQISRKAPYITVTGFSTSP